MAQEPLVCPLTKGERILVAVDGSRHSDVAMDHATSLGAICNSRLFAMTVIDIDLYPKHIDAEMEVREKMEKDAKDILKKAKKRAAEKNIPCESIIHFGRSPHKFIIQEAKGKNIDLIVMGAHGRTGFKKSLMGSVTQKVIGCAPCSVMVIPG